MDAFNTALEHTFRNRKVRVRSQNGNEYVGFVDRVEHTPRHFILHGAERIGDGEHVGSVMISHADTVELVGQSRYIERIPLDEVSSLPYAAREFQREENLGYIERVQNEGFLGSFPVVRPVRDESGYEIVEGHKRIWVTRCAGFDSLPVEIQDLSEWEAAERFVSDHIPTERHVTDDEENHSDWYADSTIEIAIETLLDRWGDRARTLPPVAYNIDRLSLESE